MAWYGDSGGGGELATYIQTWLNRINSESIEWAIAKINHMGAAGEAFNEMIETDNGFTGWTDNADVIACATFEDLLASPTAMTAIAKSLTAMTAIAASSTARTALAASPTAMAAMAKSLTAMTVMLANSSARTAIAASPTAMAAMAKSLTARTAINGSSATKTALGNSPLKVSETYDMPVTTPKTLRAGNIWIVSASVSNLQATSSSHLTSILSPASQFDFASSFLAQQVDRFASAIAGYQNYNTTVYTLTVNYIPC